jgi:hypothetical protein
VAGVWSEAVTQFVLLYCGKCGIEFSVPEHFYEECKKEGPRQTWYCPNGHPRIFNSTLDELRRERDRLKQQIAERDDAIRRTDKELTRLRKRASAGTCPCCQRTFSNMTRHMKTKHPEFLAENVVKLKGKKSA